MLNGSMMGGKWRRTCGRNRPNESACPPAAWSGHDRLWVCGSTRRQKGIVIDWRRGAQPQLNCPHDHMTALSASSECSGADQFSRNKTPRQSDDASAEGGRCRNPCSSFTRRISQVRRTWCFQTVHQYKIILLASESASALTATRHQTWT